MLVFIPNGLLLNGVFKYLFMTITHGLLFKMILTFVQTFKHLFQNHDKFNHYDYKSEVNVI